tara:strand:+ start:2069 stop:2896 length:828 start_codon:yes stop_codon:yes gene_type:complete
MANFEDPIEENLDFAPDEVGDDDPIEQVEVEAQQEPATEDNPEDDLPEKYRGKSTAQVAKMHQELEKLNGRQAQEVGEHRKFVDEMLKRELLKNTANQQSSEEIEDPNEKFFKKPTEAMDEYLSNHPSIKQAQENALIMKAQSAQQNLQQQFPDYVEVIKNPQFKEWVDASPIRQRLYDDADDRYDVAAATELISTWKAISSVNQPEQQPITAEVKENRSKSLKAASVDTGTSSISSQKRYSRKAIQDLLKNNPDKYYAHSEEILQAYAEGRVYN